MLSLGPAKKVTIHLNEDTAAPQDFLYKEVVSFLLDHGVAGATLIRPAAGFGSHHRLHTVDASGVEGEHLPIRIEWIESPAVVERILPSLVSLITDGLIEVQDTTIVKTTSQAGRS